MTYEEYMMLNKNINSSMPQTFGDALTNSDLKQNPVALYGGTQNNGSWFKGMFKDWNMQNTMDTANLALGGFNSWMAYKNYREQRKNNAFNRKLGRANYKNQAKSYNLQVEDRARYRQAFRGNNSDAINSYLQNNQEYRRRLVDETF